MQLQLNNKLNIFLVGSLVAAIFMTTVPSPAEAATVYTCAGVKATIVTSDSSVTGTAKKDVIFLTGKTGQSVNAQGGDDLICGTEVNDVINAGDGSDTIYSQGGNDIISGGAGNDTTYAGSGNDNISGNDGEDKIYGGAGDDIIDGGNGKNTLSGDGGKDTITGGKLADTINGGVGDDKLFGNAGNDTINAGDGNDKLFGDAGNDNLLGGEGNDTLTGGAGDDTLNGEAGVNTIVGGAGKDVKTIGSKDIDKDKNAEDTVVGSGIDNGGGSTTPIVVTVPTAVKTTLGKFSTYMTGVLASKEITGKGYQTSLPDSAILTEPVASDFTVKRITWDAVASSYCVSGTVASVDYSVIVDSKTTYQGGLCGTALKSIITPAVLSSFFGIYTEYFTGALNKGDISVSGDGVSLPSSAFGSNPSYALVTNVKWNIANANGVTIAKLVMSGSIDDVNFFRNIVTYTNGVVTSNVSIIGIGNTGNLK